jgi:hypothetical protein
MKMPMTPKERFAMAERIIEAYKSNKLEIEYLDLEELKALIKTVLQVRQNVVNVDKVSEIVSKVRVTKSANLVDPILVVKNPSKDLLLLNGNHIMAASRFLVNGNHTLHSNIEIIKHKIVAGYNKAPTAIIPEDMLPEDPTDRYEVLRLIAVSLNKVEKIAQGMTKGDIKDIIAKDFVKKVDVENEEYQEVLAEAAQLLVSDIRTMVAKVKQDSLNELLNHEHKFYQYTTSEMNWAKSKREEQLGFDYEVTWAVVTPDKTYETLGKAIGNMLENDAKKSHIIFHFKNYEDIRKLKNHTIKKIAKFQETSKTKLSYEFLPWKASEDLMEQVEWNNN